MTWLPTADYVLALFAAHIEPPTLMRRDGLEGTLDKMQWGIPYQGAPTLWDQAAICYFDIVQHHYFADGNKRIGILLAAVFLAKNGYDFAPPAGEIFSVTMEVAQDQQTHGQLREWFRNNSTA